jgi:hypothetical protein
MAIQWTTVSACRAAGQILLILPVLCVASCQGPGESAYDSPDPTSYEDQSSGRPRIDSRPLAIALFPVQVVPDIIANAIVALYPGNLWPLQYLLYPVSVPYWGITDAWEGRPFWDPSALHE